LTSGGAFAVSPKGDATYAVVFPDGRLLTTSRAARAPGWSPLVSLGSSPAGTGCRPLRLAVDSAGDAVVACAGASATTPGSESDAAVRASDGTWGPLERVSSNGAGAADNVQLALADDGRALIEVIADPTVAGATGSTDLLEHLPGQGWAPTAMPFSDPLNFGWAWMAGGPGHGIIAVHLIKAIVGNLDSYGLSAAELAQPVSAIAPLTNATPKVKVRAYATLRLVGAANCRRVRHPCRVGRTAHLLVGALTARTSLHLSVARLRAGSSQPARTFQVHPTHGHVTIRLPLGTLRISTVALRDTRPHAWAIYLIVH
jgi:hypothetical protein